MLPFLAIVVSVLVLFCGLVIDVNALQNAQAQAQLAADASANSSALEYQSGPGDWVQVGKQTAALYGLIDGSNGTSISLTQRPTLGPFAGRDDALQVTVTQPSPTYFMRFVQSVPVRATAVALLPPCFVLRGSQAITASASTLQTACPVYANGQVALGGSGSWSSAGLLLTSRGSVDTGLPVSVANSVRIIGDPLAALPQPAGPGCQVTGFQQNGGSAVLQAGTYCNGMTIRNANITLSPGLYVITGGAHWTGVTLQGEGVTLYFTDGGSGYGQFVIDGSSAVALSAPSDNSTGATPGVVIFGDRAWTAQTPTDFQISNSAVQTDGIWYTTGTGLGLTNATLTSRAYLGLDLDSLSLSSSTVQGGADFSSIPTGNPFQVLGGLAE